MPPERLSILGVPVDSTDTVETVERILELIDQHKEQHPGEDFYSLKEYYTSYISTLNVDFLANIHGWGWKTVRHPELLGILRKSKIVTPDGMPIVWLSKLLGTPLKERVTGADLVPLLAESLGEKKKSLFLLGGEEKITQQAKTHLEKVNPGLKVVGAISPLVFTEGERVGEAEQRDSLILEEIHKKSPDVLLICLGHPKQEIWFERIKRKLRVPVAIGVGGTLNFITGHVKRAPKWMQSLGLEWLFRLYSEPTRLFKRYFYDALHFLFMTTPLVIVHFINQLFVSLTNRKDSRRVKKNLLFLSQNKSIAVVRVPRILDRSNVEVLGKYIDEAFSQDSMLIDFQKTRHIDPAGLGLLVNSWIRSEKEKKFTFGFGMNKALCCLLRLHRVWNLFSNDICSCATEVTCRLFHNGMASTLYEAFHQKEDTLTISFFGKLDNRQDFDRFIQNLVPMLQEKNCVIDFTYCTIIDNMGFYFLLKLKQMIENNERTLKITGLSQNLSRQFRNAGLEGTFEKAENG